MCVCVRGCVWPRFRCVPCAWTGNSRVLKKIMDEANNQIEQACLRMFEESREVFDRIETKMDQMATTMGKAQSRHDVVIKKGFGTGVRPYGHTVVQ